MPKAYFIVRATVAEAAKRKAFDTWYQNEHLPDASKSFGVTRAWRFWSLTEPSLHQATYEFADEASLEETLFKRFNSYLDGQGLHRARWPDHRRHHCQRAQAAQ